MIGKLCGAGLLPVKCAGFFLTAAVLFFSQGDIVNNIEQNVSKTIDHVTVAKEQTKKAVRYQAKAQKVNCSFCAQTLSASFRFHSCVIF